MNSEADMRVIIAGTSCLIIYEKINQLEILRDTFVELIVTDEVAEEFGSGLTRLDYHTANNE